MQVEHHHFGLKVRPEQLAASNGSAIVDAVQRMLYDPSFQVGTCSRPNMQSRPHCECLQCIACATSNASAACTISGEISHTVRFLHEECTLGGMPLTRLVPLASIRFSALMLGDACRQALNG